MIFGRAEQIFSALCEWALTFVDFVLEFNIPIPKRVFASRRVIEGGNLTPVVVIGVRNLTMWEVYGEI